MPLISIFEVTGMSDKTTPKPLNPEGISAIPEGEKDTEQESRAEAKDLTIGERFGTFIGRMKLNKPNFEEIERKPGADKLFRKGKEWILEGIDFHEAEVKAMALALKEQKTDKWFIQVEEADQLMKKIKEGVVFNCPICGTPAKFDGIIHEDYLFSLQCTCNKEGK